MNEELKPKHEAILRKAAEVVRARGQEGDAKLADSINGVIASLLARRTPTVTASSAAAAAPGANQKKKLCPSCGGFCGGSGRRGGCKFAANEAKRRADEMWAAAKASVQTKGALTNGR